jgi:hypothetical protein
MGSALTPAMATVDEAAKVLDDTPETAGFVWSERPLMRPANAAPSESEVDSIIVAVHFMVFILSEKFVTIFQRGSSSSNLGFRSRS